MPLQSPVFRDCNCAGAREPRSRHNTKQRNETKQNLLTIATYKQTHTNSCCLVARGVSHPGNIHTTTSLRQVRDRAHKAQVHIPRTMVEPGRVGKSARSCYTASSFPSHSSFSSQSSFLFAGGPSSRAHPTDCPKEEEKSLGTLRLWRGKTSPLYQVLVMTQSIEVAYRVDDHQKGP